MILKIKMKPLKAGRVVSSSNRFPLMKNFYRPLFPIAGFVALAATVLRAEEPSTLPATPPTEQREHHGRAGGMRDNIKRMTKELNLTADQQTQIEAISQQTREAMKALRNDSSLSEDQRKAKGRDLMKSSEDQIRDLLTPEQKAKAQELRQKHGRRGPGHPDKPDAN